MEFDRFGIENIIKQIDKKTIFIGMVIVFSIVYWINPLDNVELVEWNRTFSSAILSEISIENRIGNFYKLFFIFIPGIFILVICALVSLFKKRISYKDYFFTFSIILLCPVLASYISRYSPESSDIMPNPLLQSVLIFFLVLYGIAIIDSKRRFLFADIAMLFVVYLIMIISFNILFHKNEIITNMFLSSIILLGYVCCVLVPSFEGIYNPSKKFLFMMMWMPASVRLGLEGLFLLTEKGYEVGNYFSYIGIGCLLFTVISLSVAILQRKNRNDYSSIGYIGAITSITTISYFTSDYQYTWSYSSFANVYELGNKTVAIDSLLDGKLPIADYFSAHALKDVWTRIIYCIIHGDTNGVFIDPYEGLGCILTYIFLYYIIKKLFGESISILYVLLFPGIITGIKWASLCSLSVVVLVFVFSKPQIKSYIIFWMAVLLSAFIIYDEGILLGSACILAFIIMKVLCKEWKELKFFLTCGIGVGISSFCVYAIYAVGMGIPVFARIREWISVCVASSSSWATTNFGDQSSFSFLFSYFIVPITAIFLLVFVIVKFYITQNNGLLVILTIAYALAEIFYIPRTVVYHNLAVCNGVTGVLLNFVHWTISFYVLYMMSEKGKNKNAKLLAWTGTMMLVILIEGVVVTNYLPTTDSTLLSKALKESRKWELQDDYIANIGQRRVVADKETETLISQFTDIFDYLLDEDETFLDFANMTSLYAMTGRVRPFYISQSPSGLTDLFSQRCFLEQISEYNCELAILGVTETPYLSQMGGVPHNVRYYKVAEYIYDNYRPLISFGEFAIWCKHDRYNEYQAKLTTAGFNSENSRYELIDYGYDYTTTYIDDDGSSQFLFKPYHACELGYIPYIWANYDDYDAIENEILTKIEMSDLNRYIFVGSQAFKNGIGNYLAFEVANTSEDDISTQILLYDSSNEMAKIKYNFRVKSGTNQYLIRVSADYFWNVYNIDTILFGLNDDIEVSNMRILEGD